MRLTKNKSDEHFIWQQLAKNISAVTLQYKNTKISTLSYGFISFFFVQGKHSAAKSYWNRVAMAIENDNWRKQQKIKQTGKINTQNVGRWWKTRWKPARSPITIRRRINDAWVLYDYEQFLRLFNWSLIYNNYLVCFPLLSSIVYYSLGFASWYYDNNLSHCICKIVNNLKPNSSSSTHKQQNLFVL